MKRPDELLAAWEKTLARRDSDAAVLDERGEVLLTFGAVEEIACAYEQHDRFQELEEGQVLAVQIGNDPHWASLFLACLRRRVVVLPFERTMSVKERAAAMRACGAAALCTDPGKEFVRVATDTPDWGGAAPCLLKMTSGTTSMPRAVRFRSGQLLADAVQICDTMGIGETDLNFAVIPVSHSYGFSNVVTPLIARGVPFAVSEDRLPRAVLENLARTEATVFPGMPLLYQAFCELEKPPLLPKLRLCISAGAPLPQTAARRFREKFGRPIHSFYGASECGGICYDAQADREREGFVGQAMRGVHLEPLQASARATQIRVHSAAAGDGYFPEPDPEKLGAGIFVPDDLVRIESDGVRLVGRVSDVINVAGKKVNPAEVEAELLEFAGVRQAVVFGRASASRHQEVAACVVAADRTSEAELLEFCRARLSGWQVPKRIFFLDALPANERGKISRRQLAEQFGGQ